MREEITRQPFLRAQEIKEILGVSESMAYKIIRQLNAEMTEKGYRTIHGRVSRKYFEEVYYGISAAD